MYNEFWCTICRLNRRFAGPYAHPVFHPVTEKVLPADPIVIVRSHISGRVPRGICEKKCSHGIHLFIQQELTNANMFVAIVYHPFVYFVGNAEDIMLFT